jgi:hypothetical protein
MMELSLEVVELEQLSGGFSAVMTSIDDLYMLKTVFNTSMLEQV